MADRTIVVGIDGSPCSRAALLWAVEEARLRSASLRVVHAWWALPELAPGPVAVGNDWQACSERAQKLVEQFVDETAPHARSEIDLSAVAIQGVTASEALIREARDADLLVVGSRGLGGFAALLLGSVSQQCAQHAHCPVTIVRA